MAEKEERAAANILAYAVVISAVLGLIASVWLGLFGA
jgi:hypothetical protein